MSTVMKTPSAAPAERPDYRDFVAGFDARALEARLRGSLGEGINACVECCDRHPADSVALVWHGVDGARETWRFGDLAQRSAQFARLLQARGVQPGDRVAGLLPRIPELLIVLLGTLRAGAIYQPLFTAFGPKAIEHRLRASGAKLVLTDIQNRAKLDEVADCPPVLRIARPGEAPGRDADFWREVEAQPAQFAPVMRRGDDLFLMLFTSGTTGPAKGVGVPLKALPSFLMYLQYGLDLRPTDVFWNIADPGWAYGLFYAALGPLLLGQATMMFAGAFSAERTLQLVRSEKVSNFAAAPTAYRMLIAQPGAAEVLRGLRVASSAGEPLNPELMRWFAEHAGCPLHDQYGQTELGMVLMNHHGLTHAVRAGSAGFAAPGFTLAVVDGEGRPVPAGEPGILAVDRRRSPLLWFQGYWGQEGRGWAGDYHLTGDAVRAAADGSIDFIARADDVITSAGYRIGPFDVESCLIEHPAVLESAAVGKPDAARGEVVCAYVVLREGRGNDALAEELRELVRRRLGAHAYPREIVFVEQLPKTPSGKIQRFLLRDGSDAC